MTYPYGGPLMEGYGPGQQPSARAPSSQASAMVRLPNISEMAGEDAPKWYRMAFFPTAPFYSTRTDVGYQVRYYSQGILNQVANAEALVNLAFDLPVRVVAINAAAFNTAAGNALPVGVSPRDCFLFRAQYTTGDRLHVNERIASTVCGTAERPGELGATGFTVDQGASINLGITPLLNNLRIDITFHCLEMRGPRNFVQR